MEIRVVFWQTRPSPHQAAWIRALAEQRKDLQVALIFREELSGERVALGWNPPCYGNANIIQLGGLRSLSEVLCDLPESSVHVFSNIVSDPVIGRIFRQSLREGLRVGVLSEGRDWRGAKGALRALHSHWHERQWRDLVKFVLAIGANGVEWFRRCGYGDGKLFPFSYVVEAPDPPQPTAQRAAPCTLVGVGQFVARKRFGALIEALAAAPNANWRLVLVGNGPEEAALRTQASALGVEEKVVFKGVLNNALVRRELDSADVLVLPSSWDGWGAVINEALMSGVPVICSDYCGAASLISPKLSGEVFRLASRESFDHALLRAIQGGALSLERRERIRRWSQCIGGASIAGYFWRILQHVADPRSERPVEPWKA